MNKYLLVLLLLIPLLLPSQAQAMRFCQFEEPKYIVKLATTRTRYIRGKSARDLTEMHTGRSGNNIGGLGGGEIGYKVESQFEVMEHRGQYCVGVKNMKVTFYGKPQVHIASNFKKGSCEYSAVLGHEQKHIRTMRKFLREYAPRFKKEVAKISKTSRKQIGPIRKSQIKDAQEELQDQMIRRLSSYLNKVIPVLSKRQKAVDSPEEYARVFRKCKNWDKKFAKSQ